MILEGKLTRRPCECRRASVIEFTVRAMGLCSEAVTDTLMDWITVTLTVGEKSRQSRVT